MSDLFPQRCDTNAAVYDIVSEHGVIDLDRLYRLVEERFEMTEEEAARKDPEGGNLIQHEVRWALQTLKRQGKVVRGDRTGVWMSSSAAASGRKG